MTGGLTPHNNDTRTQFKKKRTQNSAFHANNSRRALASRVCGNTVLNRSSKKKQEGMRRVTNRRQVEQQRRSTAQRRMKRAEDVAAHFDTA